MLWAAVGRRQVGFINDRSLFSGDGLHLNGVGKARLGRVLDEGVKYESIRNKEND